MSYTQELPTTLHILATGLHRTPRNQSKSLPRLVNDPFVEGVAYICAVPGPELMFPTYDILHVQIGKVVILRARNILQVRNFSGFFFITNQQSIHKILRQTHANAAIINLSNLPSYLTILDQELYHKYCTDVPYQHRTFFQIAFATALHCDPFCYRKALNQIFSAATAHNSNQVPIQHACHRPAIPFSFMLNDLPTFQVHTHAPKQPCAELKITCGHCNNQLTIPSAPLDNSIWRHPHFLRLLHLSGDDSLLLTAHMQDILGFATATAPVPPPRRIRAVPEHLRRFNFEKFADVRAAALRRRPTELTSLIARRYVEHLIPLLLQADLDILRPKMLHEILIHPETPVKIPTALANMMLTPCEGYIPHINMFVDARRTQIYPHVVQAFAHAFQLRLKKHRSCIDPSTEICLFCHRKRNQHGYGELQTILEGEKIRIGDGDNFIKSPGYFVCLYDRALSADNDSTDMQSFGEDTDSDEIGAHNHRGSD